MSDHIDGPRQVGDPSADLTDLFAFPSPENPARTVLAADVSSSDASANARTAGVYWRADPEDMGILDGNDDRRRAALLSERLKCWKSITNA